jgi:YD repeat-containing protein
VALSQSPTVPNESKIIDVTSNQYTFSNLDYSANTFYAYIRAIDGLGNVTYPEQEGQVVEEYGYDEFNNRTSLINGRGAKTTYNYDRYHRLSNITDALGGKTSYH